MTELPHLDEGGELPAADAMAKPRTGRLARAAGLAPVGDGLRMEAAPRVREAAGVESEALTAVGVVALANCDCCEAVDRAMQVAGNRLLGKRASKSGASIAPQAEPAR